MAKRLEFDVGQRFSRLVVVEKISVPGWGARWKCQCDCGKEVLATGANLKSGNTRSCGCLYEEHIDSYRTHGLTKTRVYAIWKAMHRRCTKPGSPGWDNYGARGIKVCERWSKFENFFEDMGHPPEKRSIERIDNDGNYEPGNCRWATQKDQLNNRRTNVFITAFGKTQTLTEWATEYNLPVTTLKNRLTRAKMPPEEALGSPMYAQQLRTQVEVTAFGQTKALSVWAKETGIPVSTLNYRIRVRGIEPEKAMSIRHMKKVG